MARIAQKGCNYFNVDVDMLSDRKLVRLRRKYEHSGFYVYFALLTQIYKNKGYYIEWNEEEADIFSEQFHVDYEQLEKIIQSCLSFDLFDKTMFDNCGILTSRRIQASYLRIKSNSRNSNPTSCMPLFFIKANYFLLYGHKALRTNHFLKNFTKVDWEKYVHTIIKNDIIISTMHFGKEGEAIAFYSLEMNKHSLLKNKNTLLKNGETLPKNSTKEKKVNQIKINQKEVGVNQDLPAAATLDLNYFFEKENTEDDLKKIIFELKKLIEEVGEFPLATKSLVECVQKLIEWKNKGFSALDFEIVIATKHEEWIVNDNKNSRNMRKFFRPETLFHNRNFPKYLEEAKDRQQRKKQLQITQTTNTQKTIKQQTSTINRNPVYDKAYIEKQRQKWRKYREEGYHHTKPQ